MDTPRAPLAPLATGALALGAVVLLFQAILDPVRDGCNTSLIPSTFERALAPAHLCAAAVLSACIWSLSGPRPGRATVWGLGIAWAYGLAAAAVPAIFEPAGLVAVFAAPTLGPLALLALLVRSLLVQRSRHGAERRRAHARTALWLLWGAAARAARERRLRVAARRQPVLLLAR